MNKQVSYKAVCIVFCALVVCFAVAFYAFGWTEPGSVPPGGNVSAPLNVGPNGQVKAGGLILNTGGAANGLIVSQGRVGIGTETPGYKLNVVGGDVSFSKNGAMGLELRSTGGSMAFIDFSNDGSSDYDTRLVLMNNDLLSLTGASFSIDGNLSISGYFNYQQRNCYQIDYTPSGQTLCNAGYYVAGVWDDGAGLPGPNGLVCCR